MQYGICLFKRGSLPKRTSSTSEMVTQLLFGDHYSVAEITESWTKIITALDNYECWINNKQHTKITEATFTKLQKEAPFYSSELFHSVSNKLTQTEFPITIGGRLPFLNDKKISFDNFVFGFDGQNRSGFRKKISS